MYWSISRESSQPSGPYYWVYWVSWFKYGRELLSGQDVTATVHDGGAYPTHLGRFSELDCSTTTGGTATIYNLWSAALKYSPHPIAVFLCCRDENG